MMTARALHFLAVDVRRAPGCPGGWKLRDLSPGINIVVGPNASGKSTTARALTSVLWPATGAPQTEIAAEFMLDGATWSAELHGAHAVFQSNGAPSELPQLPASEAMRGRCSVALHDLLQIGDDELARAILREAAGNYDVEAAASALGFEANPRLGRLTKQRFQEADKAVREMEKELEARGDDYARLAGLNAQLAAAKAAQEKEKVLAKAVEMRGHARAHAAAMEALGRFDPRLRELNGNELVLLDGKERELAGLRQEREATQDAVKQAEARMAACRLPEDGIPAAKLTELKARLEELRSQEEELAAWRKSDAAARARGAQARRSTGASGDTSVATLPELNEIVRFVQEWSDMVAEKTAAQKWRDRMADSREPADPGALKEGALVLAQWLHTPAAVPAHGGRWLRPALLGLAALIAIGSVAMALRTAPLAWIGLAFALALVVIALAPSGARVASPVLFPSDRVAPPDAWEVAAVQRRLEEIWKEIAAAESALGRHREWLASEPGWQRIVEREERLEARRRELCEKMGCEIDPALFEAFVRSVDEWRQAESECAELRAKIELGDRLRRETLAVIGGMVVIFGVSEPADLAEARGMVEDLDRRNREYHTAREEKRARQRESVRIDQQCASRQREIAALLESARVEDRPALAQLIKDFADFKMAHDAEKTCRGLRDEAARFFEAHAELATRELVALVSEREAAATTGSTVDPLIKETATIETNINKVRRQTALEKAVAQRGGAKSELLGERDAKLAALAGQIVTDYVREQMGELAMPPVFERAREFFARFTAHSWELVPPDRDGNFRARDTTAGGVSRTLAELSSGTRVQLLLAVRAAFVASEERAFNVKLPLLLDETLANSDDWRARQIIDAIAELARDGRQIFYFTAQADEVAKWREFFTHRADVPYQIVDLAAARGEAVMADFERITFPPAMSAPRPDGASYEEYGGQVGAPPFDPRLEIGAVHLWHVCEDAPTLYRLLEMGLDRWGQVDDILRHGDEKALEDLAPRLRANARLIEELGRCWRQGRGRPLIREALGEGGISSVFLDRAWALAEACGLDARKLIEQIDASQLKGFRQKSRDEFEAYCFDAGYTPRDAPLEAGVIRRRLHALGAQLEIEPGRVEALLSKISA